MNRNLFLNSKVNALIKGKYGRYFWLQCPLFTSDAARPLSLMTRKVPEVVVGKFVTVTAFDSGPLRLTDAQINAGWERDRRLASSPRISNVDDVPFRWFDEWYIFNEPTLPTDVKVFVNYGAFSLGDPNPTIETIYIGTDAAVKTRMIQSAALMRQNFWEQLERIGPLSYVANGNCFIFATLDPRLYNRVGVVFQSM